MYTVVLGVDQHEAPARHSASAVANLPCSDDEVEVFVLHCFTENTNGGSVTQVTGVRAAVAELENEEVSVTVREDSGDPSDAILHQAEKQQADLVVVGGRKRSPAGKALFGSVTQSVILKSDRPVMVTGEESSE